MVFAISESHVHRCVDTDSSVLIAFKPEKIEYSNISQSIISFYKEDVVVFLLYYTFFLSTAALISKI